MDLRKVIMILIICLIAIGAIYMYTESYNNSNIVFNDMGTSANKSTDWICNNIDLVQITPNGTLINNTSPERLAYIAHSTDFWASTPVCIEFNVSEVSGNPTIHIYDGKNSFYGNLSKAKESHVKIQVNDTISWWIDETEQTPLNTSMEDCYIRFIIPQDNAIKYNDFKVYSI